MYQIITINDLPGLTRELTGKRIALDTETTGLNFFTSKVITIQFGTLEQAYILDCREFYTLGESCKLPWFDFIQGLLTNVSTIVGHNLTFDFNMLYHHFHATMGDMVDTELQELIIHGVGLGNAKSYGVPVNMQDTASRYGLTVSKEERNWFIGLDLREDWFHPLPDTQLQYCAQDVYIPLQLNSLQQSILDEKELTHIADLENACIAPISRLHYDGCFVDRDRWQEAVNVKKVMRSVLGEKLINQLTPYVVNESQTLYEQGLEQVKQWEASLQELESELGKVYDASLCGMSWYRFKQGYVSEYKKAYPKPKIKAPLTCINLNSPKQVKQALNALGIPVYSTDKDSLEPYAGNPIINDLLEWKKLDKLVNSFGDTFLNKVDIDGRIHPDYHQIGASTGRMSCSNPNWQQIPAHEDETQGATVRSCVVSQTGNVILTSDFSNIELRILAEISQDENMLSLFASGVDLHSSTARMMFGLPESVDPKHTEMLPGLTYRSAAKTINFGLMYGMSPISLASQLKISQDLAESLFKKYFSAYPRVKQWLETSSETALKVGYSTTILGRKRFYNLSSSTCKRLGVPYSFLRGKYKRQAKNAPIQGTSADITKHALILLYNTMPEYMRLVTCVHDEIVVEVPEQYADECSKIVANAMFSACRFHLQTVDIPPIVVAIDHCWKKD